MHTHLDLHTSFQRQKKIHSRTVGTRQSRAFVHSSFAVQTRVASGTVARVAAPVVFLVASASVKARGVRAGEQTVFTVSSLKARQAGADIAFVKILQGEKGSRCLIQLFMDPLALFRVCTVILNVKKEAFS